MYRRNQNNDLRLRHTEATKAKEKVKFEARNLEDRLEFYARDWPNKIHERVLGGLHSRSSPRKNGPSDAPFPAISRVDEEEIIDEPIRQRIKNIQRQQLLNSVRARLEAKYGGPGDPGRRPYEIIDHPYHPPYKRPAPNAPSRPHSPSADSDVSDSDVNLKTAPKNNRHPAKKETNSQHLPKSGGKQGNGQDEMKQLEKTSPKGGVQGKHQGKTGKKSQDDPKNQDSHDRRNI